jgi:hypothetical protein
MKAYVLTTGAIFLLIVIAHVARLFSEGAHLLKQPMFAMTSILSLALVLWAWRMLSRLLRPHAKTV